MTRLLRHTTTLLAVLAAALAVVPAASSAPDVLRTPTDNCWRDVINDWVDNNRIDKVYALPCYAEAVQRLNAYPDVAGYSSAIDDIRSAQRAAIHSERGDGFGGGTGFGGPTGGSSGGSGGDGTSGGTGNGSGSPAGGSGDDGFLGMFGASDAQSVPLPLLVLGGLAILLALAALAAWLARRYQGRRPAPAPAVPRRR
jgi:hypothetical protein